MAFSFFNPRVEPLPIGGAARLWVRVEGATEVMAVFGTSVVLDPDVLPLDAVGMPLSAKPSSWEGVVWGVHGGTKLCWFARAGSGAWEAGPVTTISLPFAMKARFPVPLGWVVDRFQDYASGAPPLRSRPFNVASSYPRDTAAWPVASVQVADISPSSSVVGNLLSAPGSLGSTRRIGSAYNLSFDLVCWCATPEDRRILTPWLAGALEAVRLCAMEHPDLYEPHFSLSESEDFATLGVPAFLSTARLTATVLSLLEIPENTTPGRVTVP